MYYDAQRSGITVAYSILGYAVGYQGKQQALHFLMLKQETTQKTIKNKMQYVQPRIYSSSIAARLPREAVASFTVVPNI